MEIEVGIKEFLSLLDLHLGMEYLRPEGRTFKLARQGGARVSCNGSGLLCRSVGVDVGESGEVDGCNLATCPDSTL